MRHLLYWLRLVDLVWTKDSDDDVRLRIVLHDKDGNCYARSVSNYCIVQLLPGGKVKEYQGRNAYITSWRKYPDPKKPRLSPWKRSNTVKVAGILQGTDISA